MDDSIDYSLDSSVNAHSCDGTPTGHRRDGTPTGHRRDTTASGHRRDTDGTPPGHQGVGNSLVFFNKKPNIV